MPMDRDQHDSRDVVGSESKTRLADLAGLFFRLGITSFGGPAAHIALMEHEVVHRLGWLGRDEFLDVLGATNLIPGPNSTEMAIHIGWRAAGWQGLVVAGLAFIIPAVFVVLAIAWVYVNYGARPEATPLLHGIQPVVIAIIIQALWRLGRQALRSSALVVIGVLGGLFTVLGVNELVVLFASGILLAVIRKFMANLRTRRDSVTLCALPLGSVAASLGSLAAGSPVPFGLVPLFLFFLKVGSILFGSGYMLIAFLRADLVEHWGWLTDTQLLDAITVGQVTPGPLFTTATFIGYLLGGFWGAVLATIGIFLPAFIFVAVSGPVVPRLRRSILAAGFLDGVNAASVALIAVVTWQLGLAAFTDKLTIVIAILAGIALGLGRVNSFWLILVGGLIGVVRARFG